MSLRKLWERAWRDYTEIVLRVDLAAELRVVAESAIRIANTEGAVVRFNFNGVDLAVTSPNDTIDSIVSEYDDGLDKEDVASADTEEA